VRKKKNSGNPGNHTLKPRVSLLRNQSAVLRFLDNASSQSVTIRAPSPVSAAVGAAAAAAAAAAVAVVAVAVAVPGHLRLVPSLSSR